jgi:hypothetical protein
MQHGFTDWDTTTFSGCETSDAAEGMGAFKGQIHSVVHSTPGR